MKRITRTIFATAMVGTAMLAASAANADVKIGFLGGFTGPIESLVPPIFEGAKLAVTQVNDQGGILDGREGNRARRSALLGRDHRGRQQCGHSGRRRHRLAGRDLTGHHGAGRQGSGVPHDIVRRL